MGLHVGTVFGGVSQGPQVSALRRGIDVLVACPGRLEDLIQQRHCDLGSVVVCVLDEADHLADLGFLPAVRRLLDQMPAGGQRLLFSATLDQAVDGIARRYLTNPILHSVDGVGAPHGTLDHHTFTVAACDKAAVVRELASGEGRSLLFTRTKHAARKVTRYLNSHGIAAVDLHGNLSQAEQDRNLAAFAAGSARVLVATDIAPRGLHIDGIELEVHVDPPAEHKAYLHRSGRTARAGARGKVVTVILPEQASDVSSMIRQAGIRPTAARIVPGAPETLALTGPRAGLVHRSSSPAPASASAHGGLRRPRRATSAPGRWWLDAPAEIIATSQQRVASSSRFPYPAQAAAYPWDPSATPCGRTAASSALAPASPDPPLTKKVPKLVERHLDRRPPVEVRRQTAPAPHASAAGVPLPRAVEHPVAESVVREHLPTSAGRGRSSSSEEPFADPDANRTLANTR